MSWSDIKRTFAMALAAVALLVMTNLEVFL